MLAIILMWISLDFRIKYFRLNDKCNKFKIFIFFPWKRELIA